MEFGEGPLYGEMARACLADGLDGISIGHGVTLRSVTATMLAPYIVAFGGSDGEKAQPPFRKIGSCDFDIALEIRVPGRSDLPDLFDGLNTIAWLTTMIRLKATPFATVPLILTRPIDLVTKDDDTVLLQMETHAYADRSNGGKVDVISDSDISWIRDHWLSAGQLAKSSEAFRFALSALDSAVHEQSIPLALIQLWAGLERLFSPGREELRFRISAYLAAYLEDPGPKRLSMHKKVRKLYDERSQVAHGAWSYDHTPFVETYFLARRVLRKIVRDNSVPTMSDLENRLFGVEAEGCPAVVQAI